MGNVISLSERIADKRKADKPVELRKTPEWIRRQRENLLPVKDYTRPSGDAA